jgi:hypothetical protein
MIRMVRTLTARYGNATILQGDFSDPSRNHGTVAIPGSPACPV